MYRVTEVYSILPKGVLAIVSLISQEVIASFTTACIISHVCIQWNPAVSNSLIRAEKGALLYMTKIKRFYAVHEPNENLWKYEVSITSKMAFTESLLLQKGYFLSIQELLFSFFKWGTLTKGHFFTFKNVGGGEHMPPLPPSFAAPVATCFNSTLH